MSFSLELSSLDRELKRKIKRELTVKGKKTQYNPKPRSHRAYSIDSENDEVVIPLGQWSEYLDEFPCTENEYPRTNVGFSSEYSLFTKESDPDGRGRDQDVIVAEVIQQLHANHVVFIAASTGTGKTIMGTYLITELKMKVVVVCDSQGIREQWKDQILKFTDNKCKIQKVAGKKGLNPEADVYLVGPRKIVNMTRDDFIDVGMVIVDEAHLTTEAISKALLMVQPLYLIGLSATPDRTDGMDKLLHIYFGPERKFIYRAERKNFTVIKYQTNFKPNVEYIVVRGKTVPNWGEIRKSIEYNPKRQQLIADLAMSYKDDKILILSYHVKQSLGIYNYLIKKGESAEKFIAKMKKFDRTKRVIVIGLKKGGVGLDIPDATLLFMATDVRDVRQYEGRIRTTDNIVIDIVDDYHTFEKHWEERREWYLERGATIVTDGPRTIIPISRSKQNTQEGPRFLHQ